MRRPCVVRRAMLGSLLAALAAGSAACGVIGSTGADDADDEPTPLERRLTVEEITPADGPLATKPVIRVRFNDYLEDDSFTSFGPGTLQTGALAWSGWASWVMTDKTFVWRARTSLPDGLRISYFLPDSFESVTGGSFRPDNPLANYTTDADIEAPSYDPYPETSWQKVRGIFEQHCTSCHGAERWHELNPLTHDSLVGEPSDQVDRLLVRPHDPADSYLMQKLLWDYPRIRFAPQPPEWAGGKELPREDLLAIEGWIAGGAKSHNP